MEIQVELTEQDHLDFYRQYGLKRNWVGKAIVILLIDIVFCSIVSAISIAVLLVFIIITAILYFFFFHLPYISKKNNLQKLYRLDPSSAETKVYKPFSAGIEIIEGDKNRFLR